MVDPRAAFTDANIRQQIELYALLYGLYRDRDEEDDGWITMRVGPAMVQRIRLALGIVKEPAVLEEET